MGIIKAFAFYSICFFLFYNRINRGVLENVGIKISWDFLKNIGEGILVIKFKINKIIHLSFE
jgi:hypothetical protein